MEGCVRINYPTIVTLFWCFGTFIGLLMGESKTFFGNLHIRDAVGVYYSRAVRGKLQVTTQSGPGVHGVPPVYGAVSRTGRVVSCRYDDDVMPIAEVPALSSGVHYLARCS